MNIVTSNETLDRNSVSGALLELADLRMKAGRDEEALETLVNFMMNNEQTNNLDINPEVINFIIKFLLPPVLQDDFSEDNFSYRINRLTHFMSLVLDIDMDCKMLNLGIIDIEKKRIDVFESIVKYTLKCIEHLLKTGNQPILDLYDVENYMLPLSTNGVNLGIVSWPSLTRVVGFSRQDDADFFEDSLVQSLRFISILYEVNQNWSMLFSNLSSSDLIFLSKFEIIDLELSLFSSYSSNMMYCNYLFLFQVQVRSESFRHLVQRLRPSPADIDKRLSFLSSREEPLKDMASCLELYGSHLDPFAFWDFTFQNEMGIGPGPTREFYTLFSRDIARYDLNLWNGDSLKSADGMEYVDSSCGLFPSPSLNIDDQTKNVLKTVGVIMAKALLDGYFMDLNFSKALYKCMQCEQINLQCLKLSDIKYVVPSLTRFIEGLLDISKITYLIYNTTELTSEQKSQKISELQFDGEPLEDLCINFTIPGFPDIEMIEGGKETMLTPWNIREYLDHLVWWLLYKGPQEKLTYLRKGFESILPLSCLNLLISDDVDQIFCGANSEQLTIGELEDNCSYDCVTPSRYIVDELFEILASFSKEEIELLLKFVTGSPKLPVGGLANLSPPLTIFVKKSNCNPDSCLPSAMTCSNTLLIAEYSCAEIMKEKLLYAIKEGADTFQFL